MKYVIWLVILALIVVRYFFVKPEYRDGDKVRITSVIYSDPVKYEKSQYIKLHGLQIYLPLFPQIYYGDRVVIEGDINGNKLDNAILIENTGSSGLTSSFRNSILYFYERNIPQPESGLLAGIVLGSKGALTNEFYENTKLVGVTHVVVASGTNISFIVSFCMNSLVLIVNRRKAIYFVILSIILYLFMSGFQAPLIRASIMSSVLLLSQNVGRVINTWRIFFLTAIGMLIVNPYWILDMGFILSFAATASLLLFEKRISQKFERLPKFLKEGFSTSLAAQIGVFPILIVIFRQFNILSVLVNGLVLWTVPFIMISGAVAGIFQSKLILYISYPFLKWFTFMVWIFTKITGLFTF